MGKYRYRGLKSANRRAVGLAQAFREFSAAHHALSIHKIPLFRVFNNGVLGELAQHQALLKTYDKARKRFFALQKTNSLVFAPA